MKKKKRQKFKYSVQIYKENIKKKPPKSYIYNGDKNQNESTLKHVWSFSCVGNHVISKYSDKMIDPHWKKIRKIIGVK